MDIITTHIRTIENFPRPGIAFKDITPLVKNPEALRFTVQKLIQPFQHEKLTAVVGMEARGFIFGSLAAWEMGIGFVPLRKPGKLPHSTNSAAYDLEYGSAALEVHTDALDHDDTVLLVDDLIATGGTARASCQLIESLGATIHACAFVIELNNLNGRARLDGHRIHSLIQC